MKTRTLFLAILLAPMLLFSSTAFAERYANIKPELKCHVPRKDKSFCKKFPNFSLRKGICEPAMLGHIEWCREDVTITERKPCGDYETYEAVTITYRPVYENGAWGDKFQKTYRKQSFVLETPPVISK